MGDLCAWITFATVSERVENMMTSPDVWVAGVDWLVDCAELGAVGEGTGEGYARYDASAEGDKAQTATIVVRSNA